MKRRMIAFAAVLCALPASGDNTLLPERVINVLTPIDSIPSRSTLNTVFATPQIALETLQAIALDHTVDVGVELRAIRALPAYCPQPPTPCGTGTTVHDTLRSLIDSLQQAQETPTDLLRLRAAVEALGATRSGLAEDVEALRPLLGHWSRDVRATVVHALQRICNGTAVKSLQDLRRSETTDQVQLAILRALPELLSCPS